MSKAKSIVDSYLTRVKKNSYTQGAKRDYFYGYPQDGNTGYSDCSSSWRAAYKRGIGIDIGGNTVAQITNKKLIQVCLHTKGQPDATKLKIGDLLYFKGSDSSRPYSVGHVEGYIGGGNIAGHGSGIGPRITNMESYCADRYSKGRGLIKVLRVIDSDTTETPAPHNSDYPLGFGDRILRYGCAGNDVSSLQRALITLNFSCGKWGADGEFGNGTLNAVKAYQKSKGTLEVDGEVGKLTRAKLEIDMENQGDNDESDQNNKRILTIVGGDAYIRSQPNTSALIIGVAYENTTYAWNGETSDNGWQSVDVDGEYGWISGKYAKL